MRRDKEKKSNIKNGQRGRYKKKRGREKKKVRGRERRDKKAVVTLEKKAKEKSRTLQVVNEGDPKKKEKERQKRSGDIIGRGQGK